MSSILTRGRQFSIVALSRSLQAILLQRRIVNRIGHLACYDSAQTISLSLKGIESNNYMGLRCSLLAVLNTLAAYQQLDWPWFEVIFKKGAGQLVRA